MRSDAARALAAASHAVRRAKARERRDQVLLLLHTSPRMTAEEVARHLRCSPSTVRGDWRALRGKA